jgi:hypothetical protein
MLYEDVVRDAHDVGSDPVPWPPGFIVTNLARPAGRVVAFYNHRGTAEQRSERAGVRLSGRSCHAATLVAAASKRRDDSRPDRRIRGMPVKEGDT